MALTYSVNPPQLVGAERVVTGTITFDNSYLTAGETFSPTAVGLTSLKNLEVGAGLGSSTTAYVPVWNRSVSAPKVQAFWGDNNNAADAALIEVTSTTDLSALVCGFRATGY
jgi:hypothetical protein